MEGSREGSVLPLGGPERLLALGLSEFLFQCT